MLSAYGKENKNRSFEKWGAIRGMVFFLLAVVLLVLGQVLLRPDLKPVTAILSALAIGALLAWLVVLLAYRTPKMMWEQAQQRINYLEERRRPKLDLVFEGETRPYLQRIDLISEQELWIDRRCRVGVCNLGSEPIEAALILEDWEPREANVFPDHSLQVMDEREPTKRVLVPPSESGRPTKFFDVVYDRFPQGRPKSGMRICYYQDVPNSIPLGTYTITLRLEGGPAPCRKKFIVEKESPEADLKMSLLPTGVEKIQG